MHLTSSLNLTAASYVFVFEPAWNPAIEQQAVDRVHRLGQTSNVNVIRYIAKGIAPLSLGLTRDSIEENMVQLQQKKKELADLVNQKRTKEELSSDRLRDLRLLFSQSYVFLQSPYILARYFLPANCLFNMLLQ